MEGNSIEEKLQIFFSKSSLEDWKKMAQHETHGKDPFEILSWRGKDEILFLPYYDAEKDAHQHFLKRFQLPAAKKSHARSWINVPALTVSDEKKTNTLALDHLMNGADGVIFDTRETEVFELNPLISNIEWPHCYIGFYMREIPALQDALSPLLQEKIFPASVNGALFWESIPKKSNLDFYFEHCANFQALGLIVRGSSPSDEISEALLNGVAAYETYVNDADASRVFRSVCFSLSANSSVMETVAKFKAMRILWYQIAQTYKFKDYRPEDLRIHARSDYVADGNYSPHENMLKATFSAMAAVFGGCDMLTVDHAGRADFVSRWARNVSSILREESFLNQITDPLAGAYALESMTDAIAKKAWDIFKKKWRAYA